MARISGRDLSMGRAGRDVRILEAIDYIRKNLSKKTTRTYLFRITRISMILVHELAKALRSASSSDRDAKPFVLNFLLVFG